MIDRPLGGSELMYINLTQALDLEQNNINLILSNCHWENIQPNKINILWQQLNINEENVQGINNKNFVDSINYFVWVSYWCYEKYRQKYNIPDHKSIIIRNASQPIPFFKRPKDKIKLIYTSTPWRGLDVLLKAFNKLQRSDVELDVFSSTKIYGPHFEKLTQGRFEQLWDLCRSTPGVNYHGYQPNSVVLDHLSKAHIFAYPNTFEETSCIAAIEALTAGCQVITTGYGALPETCGDWASYIPYGKNSEILAERFAYELNRAIDNYWSEETQEKIQAQSLHYNRYHTWPIRINQWREFFAKITRTSNGN